MFKSKTLCVSLLLLGFVWLMTSSSQAAEGNSAAEEQKKAQLFIKGAQLWPNYCANCHNPRGPSERSPADWDLVMMHMRSRANIPPDAAEAIIEFLKKR